MPQGGSRNITGMIKSLLFALVLTAVLGLQSVSTAYAAEPVAWQGTVTAVNSNGNRPGHSFTAVDANGQVKFFHISTLEYLKVDSRVELRYLPGNTFPLEVTRIRFLPPLK